MNTQSAVCFLSNASLADAVMRPVASRPSGISVACKISIKGDNVLDVDYDATALEFWVAYAKKDIEAYKRRFVHVRLKDYLH